MRRSTNPARQGISRRPHRFSHRHGQALVYFILILFAVMSLAALVIDLGFARLTQRQMQSAVDTAALEGLRHRDSLSDTDRRQAASNLAAMVFDDDLNPANGDPARLSAGPVITFGPEQVPVTEASQLMSIENDDVYDPVLELNLADNVSGDMVAGAFQGAAVSHQEANDYSRVDFTPSDGNNAFLVRLRRTDEDFSSFTDSHSSGPTVPVLFGRGSVIDRDLLARGTVVRATAIADARNVFSVGFADDTASPELPGLAEFALELTYWNGLTDGSPDSQVLSGGQIGPPGNEVGRFFTITSSSVDMPVMVGRALPAATSPAVETYTGYVSVYTSVSDGVSMTDRVIGYGRATAIVSSGMVEITRQSAEVAAENAAANFLYPSTLSSVGLENVLSANSNDLEESLLAPVSVR